MSDKLLGCVLLFCAATLFFTLAVTFTIVTLLTQEPFAVIVAAVESIAGALYLAAGVATFADLSTALQQIERSGHSEQPPSK